MDLRMHARIFDSVPERLEMAKRVGRADEVIYFMEQIVDEMPGPLSEGSEKKTR